jgi:hypothetical protein
MNAISPPYDVIFQHASLHLHRIHSRHIIPPQSLELKLRRPLLHNLLLVADQALCRRCRLALIRRLSRRIFGRACPSLDTSVSPIIDHRLRAQGGRAYGRLAPGSRLFYQSRRCVGRGGRRLP